MIKLTGIAKVVKERCTGWNMTEIYQIVSGMKQEYYSTCHDVRKKGHHMKLSHSGLKLSIFKLQRMPLQETVEAKTPSEIKK